MKDSTRRSLRTAYQLGLAVLTVIPFIALVDPSPAGAVAWMVGAGTVVTKLVNALEEKRLIPSWLKGDATVGTSDADAPPVPVDPAGEVPPPVDGGARPASDPPILPATAGDPLSGPSD